MNITVILNAEGKSPDARTKAQTAYDMSKECGYHWGKVDAQKNLMGSQLFLSLVLNISTDYVFKCSVCATLTSTFCLCNTFQKFFVKY